MKERRKEGKKEGKEEGIYLFIRTKDKGRINRIPQIRGKGVERGITGQGEGNKKTQHLLRTNLAQP